MACPHIIYATVLTRFRQDRLNAHDNLKCPQTHPHI